MTKTLYLHIGQGKTGTTAIQKFLAVNRARFADEGYLVPQAPGKRRHTLLSLYCKSDEAVMKSPAWRNTGFDTPSDMRRHLEANLLSEISESPHPNVVMSDEAIYGNGPKCVKQIHDLVGDAFGRFVVVVYFRRQDEHAVSRYKQTLREGGHKTIYEFLENERNIRFWNYYERLEDIRAAVPDVVIEPRPYHKSLLKQTPITEDFCLTIGAPTGGWTDVTDDVNPSLDATTSEFLRRYNARNGRAPADLIKKLVKLSNGMQLRLPDEAQKRFMGLFEDSNTKLVQRYFPDREDVYLSPPVSSPGVCQEDISPDDLRTVEEHIAT